MKKTRGNTLKNRRGNARKNQRGNALFLILIAITLFAAISYAVTKSNRNAGNADREKAQLNAAVQEQCNAYVEHAVNRLELMSKCSTQEISYEIAGGVNANALAPADKHCHVFDPAGAGATPCGLYTGAFICTLTALAVGEKCPLADIVYVGMSGGRRVYTTLADQGTAAWNDGNWGAGFGDTGASSDSDGLANTDALVAYSTSSGVSHDAALMCRSLGAKWYLPARDEMATLDGVQTVGALNGTISTADDYWSSSQENCCGYYQGQFWSFNTGWSATTHRNITKRVRCMRRD